MMTTQRTSNPTLPTLLLVVSAFLFVGCGNSGVDPDTANVRYGDIDDTISVPTLEKAALRAGLIGGSGGNTVVQDFVPVRSRVRYLVDTLSDGSIAKLRNIQLESILDDPDDPDDLDDSNPFHPIGRIYLQIPSLSIRPNGTARSELIGDPDALGVPGLLVELRRGSDRARVFVRGDNPATDGWADVSIESIDRREHRVSLAYSAELVRPDFRTGDRLPSRLHLEGLIELPY